MANITALQRAANIVNEIPIKIPVRFFTKLQQQQQNKVIKFIPKYKSSQIATVSKKSNAGERPHKTPSQTILQSHSNRNILMLATNRYSVPWLGDRGDQRGQTDMRRESSLPLLSLSCHLPPFGCPLYEHILITCSNLDCTHEQNGIFVFPSLPCFS